MTIWNRPPDTDSIEFFNIDKEPITRESTTIEWDAKQPKRGPLQHFMMKEIYEQPAACPRYDLPRLKDGQIDLSELALDEEAIPGMSLVSTSSAAGSAYHVGMAARYVFESLARIPVEVDVASEFRYRIPCSNRTHSLWSSARAVRPPTRWPPCACARSAVCAPSAL